MAQQVNFKMKDKNDFMNCLSAIMEHTASKIEVGTIFFHRQGIVMVSNHKDNVSALIVTICSSHLQNYKRDHDKDKATKNLYNRYAIKKSEYDKLKKFFAAGKEKELEVSITDRNWTFKNGALKKTMPTYEGDFDSNKTADNLRKLFDRVTGAIQVLGSMKMEAFNRYVRHTEVACRKIPSWERKKATFTVKGKLYTIFSMLDTDEMEIDISEELLTPKKKVKELSATINIEELGQASKHFSKLAETAYIRLDMNVPMVVSNTLNATDEDLYEEPMNFFYLLSPMIDDS